MVITLKVARELGEELGIDFEVFDLKIWRYGLEVELEHGTINPKTNITNDNLRMTAKIALAHIMEFFTYYEELDLMEEKLKKQWKGKRQPKFLK